MEMGANGGVVVIFCDCLVVEVTVMYGKGVVV